MAKYLKKKRDKTCFAFSYLAKVVEKQLSLLSLSSETPLLNKDKDDMKEGECEDDRAADGVEPGVHWVQHVVEGRAKQRESLDANTFSGFEDNRTQVLNQVHNGVEPGLTGFSTSSK